MQKVPKKMARKGLKPGAIALALAAVILLAGAGAYFLRRPAALPPLPETEQKAALLTRPEEDIESIAIQPAEGLAYPLVRTEAGFVLLGKESVALRSQTVQEILTVCADLRAESAILDTALTHVALADFSLDPALTRVVIGYQDGERREVLIGAVTPDEIPQRYCMVGGDSHIYSILTSDADVFFHDPDFLRSFSQPDLRGDLLDRVTVSGEIELAMRYTPSGWLMEAPFVYPLSTARTDALLARIESMAFDACLGADDEVDLARYGLDQPALTVTLLQAQTLVTGQTEDGQEVSVDVPEMEYTLLLGKETGQSGVYVWWDHGVYRASNFLLGFWKELNPRDLLLRQPVNLLINDLNRVALETAEKTAAYEITMVETITPNNQIATDEYGRVLYDAAVRRAGETQDMDAAAFLAWYESLAALAPAGELPPNTEPAGEPWAKILLQNDALTREIAFYPYDALHSAMAVDGVCVFYVENSAVEALIQSAP